MVCRWPEIGPPYTGTIAARLLAELGVPAAEAVRRVRKARPGAIETAEQEGHALAVRALPTLPRSIP
jgi:ADP-ribosyl-[dinitrogen reductase] hydrolase